MSSINDNFFDKKKEWSKTKDSILGSYLTPYFQKLLAYKKPICYVDCFAGRGMFKDGEKGSPLIALDCLDADLLRTNYNTKVSTFFIELNHHEDLKSFVYKDVKARYTKEVISGSFENNIDSILSKHDYDSVFLYVDPYGIKALDMQEFNGFKTRESKSVEMLINFNTWGFFREACRVLKVDFKLEKETSSFLIEYEPSNDISRDELCTIAGGDYWIQIVLDYKNCLIKPKEAEQRIAKGIANSLKSKYKYVLNVPVKSNPENATPKYRLFHLTNHEAGCLLMADIMHKRINEAMERQRNGQLSLFPFTGEGEIETIDSITKKVASNLTNRPTRISVFLCNYFVEYGIETDAATLKKVLRDLEGSGEAVIDRIPSVKNGKKTTFMTETKGQKVNVYRREK
jgi:three-Cys-motif partner protein